MEPWSEAGQYHRGLDAATCVIDIDGVLNTYPDCWVNYINIQKGTSFNTLWEAKERLSYADYKAIKHKYRSSGIKASLPVANDAAKFLHWSRQCDLMVVLLTARPVDRYPRMWKDTLDWLNLNELYYDKVEFSQKKQYEILMRYPTMEFMIEDNRHTANLVANLGFRVYLINNKYNQGDTNKNVVRVTSLMQVMDKERKRLNA